MPNIFYEKCNCIVLPVERKSVISVIWPKTPGVLLSNKVLLLKQWFIIAINGLSTFLYHRKDFQTTLTFAKLVI